MSGHCIGQAKHPGPGLSTFDDPEDFSWIQDCSSEDLHVPAAMQVEECSSDDLHVPAAMQVEDYGWIQPPPPAQPPTNSYALKGSPTQSKLGLKKSVTWSDSS